MMKIETHVIIYTITNVVVHLLTKDEKTEQLRVIVESYYLFLEDKEQFYDWFTMENSEELTGFDIAAQKGNKEIIKFLFEIISKTDEGKLRLTEKRNSVFHNAAKKNQCYPIIFFYEKLQKFFPNNKIFDTPNQYNITPLHYACYNKCSNAIDLLLDLGSDFNAVDVDGKSVLSYAVCSGSTRTVKKLLIRGADKSIKEIEGKTPYDLAKEKNNQDMCDLLRKKSICEKICSVEIGSIKGIRHDYELLNFFVFYFIIIYGFIMFFIPNVDYTKDENKLYNLILLLLLVVSILFVFLSMVIGSYFICCFKRRRRSKKAQKPLIELFEDSQNVCVKCRKIMKYNTVHCLVCDVCVDNWDHHCFWLNTCINKKGKPVFLAFFFLLFLSLIANVLLGVFTLLGLLKEKIKGQTIYQYYFSITAISLFIVLFTYPLLFNLIPICKDVFKSKKEDFAEDASLSEIETKLLSGTFPPKQGSISISSDIK